VAVEADAHGQPQAIVVQGRFQRVREISESWRIDDEWWRDEIARRYFAVEFENGRRLTVYHDLIGGGWFIQTYDGPQSAGTIIQRKRRA
jgi:hypothetical protein